MKGVSRRFDDSAGKKSIQEFVDATGEASLSQLAEGVGIDIAIAFTLAEELVEAGAIRKDGRFTYGRLASDGEEPTEETDEDATDSSGVPAEPTTLTVDSVSKQTPSAGTSPDRDRSNADNVERRSTKERAWGGVLIVGAALFSLVASLSIYSVWSGGLFGILSVELALGIGISVGVLGLIGFIQGYRAYHGLR